MLCENLILPYKKDDIIIKHVGDSAFRFHTRIKTLYIPNTIEILGFDCFAYIPTLESIIFEERYESALTFAQGVFALINMKIIRLPSKIYSVDDSVFGWSKIEKVIYCGMDPVYSNWFPEMPPPLIYVHPLYPYKSFGYNNTNLAFTNECGVYMKNNIPSIFHRHCFYFRLEFPINVFILLS